MPPQLSVEMTGDEVKLFKSLQKVIGQQKRMEQGFDTTSRKGKKAGEDTSKAFGDKALTSVRNFAFGIASVSTATQFASQMMQHLAKETGLAMDQTTRLADARRRLTQVSGGDIQVRRGLKQRADAAAVRFGVERDEAARFLFAARSEGFEDDFEELLALTPTGSAEGIATVAGQTPNMFKGQVTPVQAVSAVLAGAAESRADFEMVAAALPAAAAGSALNQGSVEETIAALSVITGRTKSPDVGATTISTFAAKASLDERTKGQGIVEAVRTVQQMSEDDRRAFLGESKELNTAYTLLGEELGEIERQMAVVSNAIATAGTDQSIARRNVRTVLADPGERAEIEANKARIAREIATEERFAVHGFQVQQARDRTITQLMGQRDTTAGDMFLSEKAMDIVQGAGGDGELVEFAGLNMGNTTRRMRGLNDNPFGVGQEIVNELKTLREITERKSDPNTLSQPDADR